MSPASAAPRPWLRWLLGAALILAGCAGMLGLAAVALPGLGLVAVLWSEPAGIVVTGHAWERRIAVETLIEEKKEDWEDEIPEDATRGDCRKEQRDTRPIKTGEQCSTRRHDNGDGSFSKTRRCTPTYRDEPVYAQRCAYTVQSWQITDTARASGEGTAPAPAWPTPSIANPGTCVGCQREGKRSETYTLHVLDERLQERTCWVDEDRWLLIADGSRWRAPQGVLLGQVDCRAMVPM